MRRWLAVAMVGLGGAAAAGVAAADTVMGMHAAPLALGPARVEVAIVDRLARTTVRYDVINPSATADEAEITIDAPAGAVATGLRVSTGGRWLDGRLLDAEDARARYQRFVEAPFVAARGPALLEGGVHAPLRLTVLFVPARGRVTVEYQLEAPVCYAHGRWLGALPGAAEPSDDGGDAAGAPPRVTVRGPTGAGRVVAASALVDELGATTDDLCAQQAPADAWSGDHLAMVDAGLARGHRSVLAVAPAGAGRLSELTVDVGAELAPAPIGAAVVFVIDASKSMGEAGVDAQLDLIRAWLGSAPTARVDGVIYQRHAQRVFGALQPATAADRLLPAVRARALPLRNGSNLDAGLALAADVLAAAPGPRRLIALTDDRVRDELDDVVARDALDRLPDDAIVHLLSVAPADTSDYARNFGHWLAPVAARWGGVAGDVWVGGAAEPAAARVEAFAELVRPRHLEDVVIVTGDGQRHDLGDLGEGTGVRMVRLDADDAITVTGFIWGRRWEPRLVTTPAAARRVAALAFGDPDLLADLDDTAQRALAHFGRVVSDHTSLFAADPRWQDGGLPPDVGLVVTGRTICGISSSVTGSVGHSISTRIGPQVTREAPGLDDQLAGPVALCALRHRRAAWDVVVEVETTGREVVDVAAWSVAPPADTAAEDAAFAACLVEAGWALDLDDRFASWTRRFTTRIAGARP